MQHSGTHPDIKSASQWYKVAFNSSGEDLQIILFAQCHRIGKFNGCKSINNVCMVHSGKHLDIKSAAQWYKVVFNARIGLLVCAQWHRIIKLYNDENIINILGTLWDANHEY